MTGIILEKDKVKDVIDLLEPILNSHGSLILGERWWIKLHKFCHEHLLLYKDWIDNYLPPIGAGENGGGTSLRTAIAMSVIAFTMA